MRPSRSTFCRKAGMAFAGLATAVLAVGAALPARAVDYEITVPVKIQDVHKDVKGARIACGVWIDEAGARRHIGWDSAGLGMVSVALTNGGYSGDVTVKVVEKDGRDASKAKAWACGIILDTGGADGLVEPVAAQETGKPESVRAKPGTAFTPYVWGKL